VPDPNKVELVSKRSIAVRARGDGNSTVKVFNVADCLANPETAKPVHTIITGSSLDKRADEMCYDPADNLIMVANNAAARDPDLDHDLLAG
jgi:hypothetical protein